jgi:GTP cyclohydrolase I
MSELPKKTEELKLNDELPEPKGEEIADLVRAVLSQIGEDPNRDGLRRTPERFERALRYLTSGYRQDP